MALTRKFLTGFGLTEEQVQAIIEAHTETVNALKDQRDEYKDKADKIPSLEKTIADLKSADDTTNEWQEKYEKEHSDFEAFKQAQADKETAVAKTAAYTELLKTAGVAEKRIGAILKVTDLTELELTKEGKLKDADTLTGTIKETWSDFIETTETEGAKTPTPPAGDDGAGTVPDIPSFL